VGAGVVSLSLYMPWGESRGGAGTTLTDYGFDGQRNMEGSIGLQYFNARWHDSSLGRWTQPDSIVPQASQGVQAWDRYEFVNNSPVLYNDKTGHDAGCGGDNQDASACASSTVVIIACGQDENCGVDSDLMKDYYDFAVERKYQVYYYNQVSYNGADKKPKQNKYDMATDITTKITGNEDDSFILTGHSAGADALILANSMTDYAENIKGTVLIAPSMNYTLPNGQEPKLNSEADSIPAGKVALITGIGDSDSLQIKGATKHDFDLKHEQLATDQSVIDWVFGTFSWFR
jgi:RHS repeat-associated protein